LEYIDLGEKKSSVPQASTRYIGRFRGGCGDECESSQGSSGKKKANGQHKRAVRAEQSEAKKKQKNPNAARAKKTQQKQRTAASRRGANTTDNAMPSSSSKYGVERCPSIPPVDLAAIQKQWQNSIQFNTAFVDPLSLTDQRSIKDIMDSNQTEIDEKKRQICLGSLLTPTINFSHFRSLPCEEQELAEKIYRFEVAQYEVKNRRCGKCHGVYLNDRFDTQSGTVCLSCHKVGKKFSLKNNFHPVWYNIEGEVQWHVPRVLSCLRIGEQMLIQRYSPYAPLVHIKNGTFGCKGHVCCFPKDITEVCHVFPRLPEDVKAVKMVRHYKDSNGEENTQVYRVRKDKVLAALRWLRIHHREYANDPDFKIAEEIFDWMEGENEKNLEGVITLESSSDRQSQDEDFSNKGMSEEQCIDPERHTPEDELEVSGVVQENPGSVLNEHDQSIIESLKSTRSRRGSSSSPYMNWPLTSREAVDEYRRFVFVNSFPWLYPGGYGDVNQQHAEHFIEESQWARMQLRYFDNRFQNDPMWCFYALNFVQRHRNKKSGGFFLKDFVTDKPPTLEELKERIRNGDTKFISQLQHFSGKLEGSDAYWRKMRAELFSWINHHVEVGNGPPTIFMTLSCAEYFWPDLLNLIHERTVMSESDIQCNDDGKCIDMHT